MNLTAILIAGALCAFVLIVYLNQLKKAHRIRQKMHTLGIEINRRLESVFHELNANDEIGYERAMRALNETDFGNWRWTTEWRATYIDSGRPYYVVEQLIDVLNWHALLINGLTRHRASLVQRDAKYDDSFQDLMESLRSMKDLDIKITLFTYRDINKYVFSVFPEIIKKMDRYHRYEAVLNGKMYLT